MDLDLLARPERFELPTPWFVARYSIQLSYGRADLEKAERGLSAGNRLKQDHSPNPVKPGRALIFPRGQAPGASRARILPHRPRLVAKGLIFGPPLRLPGVRRDRFGSKSAVCDTARRENG